MTYDFKKEQKELYRPGKSPSIIDVPEMNFIAVSGKGDPNTSEEYKSAIEVLYSLSYTIKMSNKSVLEYVVPPLEGFWGGSDAVSGQGGSRKINKSKLEWTALIRQPDFVNQGIFEAATIFLAQKKPQIDTSKASFETITEGLCVQAIHIGSFDDEPVTIAAMERYAADNGYAIDFGSGRRHHEIYLSDPRKVAPEAYKTIIRHPISRL